MNALRWLLISSVLAVTVQAATLENLTLENGTRVRRFAWGAYTVTMRHFLNPKLADSVQVTRRDGRVLLEVRGTGLLSGTDSGESGEALEDFTGDGQPELHLLAWSGGAYCCYTDLLFQQSKTGVRNVLVFNGRLANLGKGKVQSVSRPPRLLLENDAINFVNGSTHGPSTRLVLEWRGDRFVDATRAFPALQMRRALEYRRALIAKRSWNNITGDDLLSGYYASAWLAGLGASARRWLIAQGHGTWLRAHQRQIEQVLERQRVWVDRRPFFYVR